MKKRLFSGLLAIVLVLSLLPCTVFGEAEEKAFAGERSVTMTVDISYLENYFVGGRQMMDLLLRKNAPQWLTHRLSGKNREITLELAFAFTSQEDYTTKLQALLLTAPGIYYEKDTLMESYTAFELLNFVQESVPPSDYQMEKTLADIFTVTENRITVNGKEFSVEGEIISIRPQGEQTVQADGLSVKTRLTKSGTYERTLQVVIFGDDRESRQETFEKQFKSVGQVKKEEDSLRVTFQAANIGELTAQTIEALRSINSIGESASFVDEKTVGVTRTEVFDLDALLTEGAQFEYTFTYPNKYKSLSVEDEAVTLKDNTLTAVNQEVITLQYQRGFQFTRVESHTDLSDPMGRITKTVRFYAPAGITAAYHNRIKKEFQDRLCKGMTFNIYDQDNMRCFEFVFKTWYPDQIADFDRAVFGNEFNTFRLRRSFVPFAKGQLEDNLQPDGAIENMLWVDEIVRTYTFPAGAKLPATGENENRTREGNKVIITGTGSEMIAFEGFYFLATVVYGVAVLAIGIVVLVVVLKLKKRKKGDAPQPEAAPEAEAVPQPEAEAVPETVPEPTPEPAPAKRFCSNCGAPLNPGAQFCGECGTKQ